MININRANKSYFLSIPATPRMICFKNDSNKKKISIIKKIFTIGLANHPLDHRTATVTHTHKHNIQVDCQHYRIFTKWIKETKRRRKKVNANIEGVS